MSKPRRNIADALKDPAAKAFIEGGKASPASPAPAPRADLQQQDDQQVLPLASIPASIASASSAALVSVTYRFQPELLDRLRHAAAVRNASRTAPYSQQAILAAALDQWLRSNGF